MPSETVRLDGHIINSLTLSKVLDIIVRDGGKYRIARFQIGATRAEISQAEISVTTETGAELDHILHLIQQHGAARTTSEATSQPAPQDGVFPDGFYATTNLETHVRINGRWTPVGNIEMDCGLVLEGSYDEPSIVCRPMHRVLQGEAVIVGDEGVRVLPLERPEMTDGFAFMGSEVSTERPKERMIEATALAMQDMRAQGKRILFVGGPAILHTGAGRYLEQLISSGWIDVLFAGNALATHDIERAFYGTSLGVELETGHTTSHGHEHHLRAINTIRGAGGIRSAVHSGILTRGIMFACVTHNVPFVLAGSIRDDGPLPDVITDSLAAQDAMRAALHNVGIALMVATTLHSVATGNLLPASVRTICVDADADTVIKLMDRGTHQAFGLVTDCEFFLQGLSARLPGVKQ